MPGSHPFATGAWRAPSNNTNTYARESQVDIMAARAGADFALLASNTPHIVFDRIRWASSLPLISIVKAPCEIPFLDTTRIHVESVMARP